MNWEDIQLFDAVASAGSLTGAAGVLQISQPQLSRRLRQLENTLSARLFDRTPQGLRPTLAGEKLIPLAKNMRSAADAVVRAKPDLASMTMGVVRINTDEVRAHFLTDHMPELLERLSGLEIEISSNHTHLKHSLRETEIQLRSCLPDSETLIARRLGIMSYAIYGSIDYVQRNQAALTPARASQCEWIGLSSDRLWYPEQKRWLDKHMNRTTKIRLNTMTGIVDACVCGVGLALLPCFIADKSDGLVRISGTREILHSKENLIVHRDLLREPAVRRTVDVIAGLFKQSKNALMGCDNAAAIAS